MDSEAGIAEVSSCPGCGGTNLRLLSAVSVRRIMMTDGADLLVRLGVSGCRSCGLLFLSPRLSESALQAYYARQSRLPRDVIASASPLGRMMDSQIDQIMGSVSTNEIRSVIEIGCAEGFFLGRIRERLARNIDLIGVEPSRRYAETARGRLPGARIVEGFIEDAELAEGAADLMVIRHVLEHLSLPVTALAKIRKLLDPAGAIYIEVPNAENFVCGAPHYFSHEHLTYFTSETLSACLARSGFLVSSIEAYPGYEHGSGFSYPVLRAIARPRPGVSPRDVPGQAERIWEAYEIADTTYVEAHLTPIQSRLNQLVANGKKLALFGAGPHTMDFLGRLNFRGYPWQLAFDNNPNKAGNHLWDIPIALPTAELLLGVDGVVFSSAEFESEMVAQVKSLVGDRVERITIYS